MFLREARVAARLNHPNVVQLFELGQDQGTYFLAMEFIDGITLYRLAKRAWARGMALPTEVIVRAVADAALGLHHAHTLLDENGFAAGLVHRDVSPDNLMITRDGVTKVLDFGIAKSREKVTATETGIVRGKPAYMSPEQSMSEELDARSDVFSLGIILYELVTGQKLFVRDTPWNTLRAVVEAPIPDPREHAPDLPQPIADAIRRALTRDLARRIESADALARLLDPVAAPAGALADVVRARFPEEHRASVVAIAQADELATQKLVDVAPIAPSPSTSAAIRSTRSRAPMIVGAFAAVAAISGVAIGVLANQPKVIVVADAGAVALIGPPPPLTLPPPAPLAALDAGVAVEAGAKPIKKRVPPPPPAPPPVVADAGQGTITVTAQPWGNVRIDGELVGPTPLMRHSVKAGPHVVEVVAPETGEVRARENVVVEANRESKVRAK